MRLQLQPTGPQFRLQQRGEIGEALAVGGHRQAAQVLSEHEKPGQPP
jgi:hypothetical protein